MKVLSIIAAMVAAAMATGKHQIDLSLHEGIEYEHQVTLRQGEHLEIKLKETPGTGYTWQVWWNDMDQHGLHGVLNAVGSIYTEDEPRYGVAGVRKISFDAIAPGKGHLNLYHARSWELKNHIDDRLGVEHFVGKKLVVEVLPLETDL